jgi:hypothetical protein
MLDAPGNIRESPGGVGVVITLVCLAAQIRQKTKSSRAESYQAAVAALSDWTRDLGMKPESSRILEAGSRDFEALQPTRPRTPFRAPPASPPEAGRRRVYAGVEARGIERARSAWAGS